MYCEEIKVCQPQEIESIKQITDKSGDLLSHALQMIYGINQFLLGTGKPINEKEFDPKCFMDSITLQKEYLIELCDELRKTEIGIGM